MRIVLQRVSRSSVEVDGETTGVIGVGLLALVGVAEGDTEADAHVGAAKTVGMRIFPDDEAKMKMALLHERIFALHAPYEPNLGCSRS